MAQAYGFASSAQVDLPAGEQTVGTIADRENRLAGWKKYRAQYCADAKHGYPDVKNRTTRAYLNRLASENCTDGWRYRAGDNADLAIGQGETTVSPLQLAVAYSAMVNGGTVYKPTFGWAEVNPAGQGRPHDQAPGQGQAAGGQEGARLHQEQPALRRRRSDHRRVRVPRLTDQDADQRQDGYGRGLRQGGDVVAGHVRPVPEGQVRRRRHDRAGRHRRGGRRTDGAPGLERDSRRRPASRCSPARSRRRRCPRSCRTRCPSRCRARSPARARARRTSPPVARPHHQPTRTPSAPTSTAPVDHADVDPQHPRPARPAPSSQPPEDQQPQVEQPQTSTPKTSTPKTSAPKTSAPKTSAARTSAPKTSATAEPATTTERTMTLLAPRPNRRTHARPRSDGSRPRARRPPGRAGGPGRAGLDPGRRRAGPGHGGRAAGVVGHPHGRCRRRRQRAGLPVPAPGEHGHRHRPGRPAPRGWTPG